MTYRLLFIALLISVLPSCTHEFSLNEMDAERKIVLFCMPSTLGDTTLIQVGRSRAVHGRDTATGGAPHLSFKLNGEAKEIHYTETPTGRLPARSYYVVETLKEGDKISLEAAYADMPAARSQTVMPQAFPLDKSEVVLADGEYGKTIQFRISFTDPAGTEDYYGMRVMKKTETAFFQPENSASDTIKYTSVELDLDNEPLFSETTGFDDIFDISKEYYRHLYIWDDSKINGKSYTLKAETYYAADYEDEEQKETIEFKIYLYKLSKEMYTYLQSLNRINNNDLGKYGLAPIRSHYTNVENGIGLLGGCNVYESEWISNPKE